jgi:hypothetical protein
MAALAGGVSGFALAYAHPAMAQQSDHPMEEGSGSLEEIVVAPRPNEVASVQLLTDALGTQSGLSPNAGQTQPEPRTPTSDLEGFIEGSVGNHGQKGIGGAVSVPLVEGKLLLSVEGYETHAGTR